MILTPQDINNLTDIAIKAATEAGMFIASSSQKKLKVMHKDAGNNLASQVVTEIDFKSQKIILRHIQPTLKKYDLALLAEETEDDFSRLDKDYFWCIDPLDGTLQFTQSVSGYAVSIALVSKKGESVIGVVYDPREKVLYHASKETGLCRNFEPWVIESKINEFSVIVDNTFSKSSKYKEILAGFENLAKENGYEKFTVIKGGGSVMCACLALENSSAVYLKVPKKQDGGGCLWDFAATTCLYNESNFVVGDVYGNPFDLNSNESLYMNKNGALFYSGKDKRSVFKLLITVI